MKPHWKKIRDVLGEVPSRIAFDAPDETWFGDGSGGLQVWSMDALHTHVRVAPRAPCSERRLFYHYRHHAYVELAAYPRGVVVTCAKPNGVLAQFVVGTDALDTREAHYRSIGFRRIGAWHHDERYSVVRTFVDEQARVELRLCGTELRVEDEVLAFADRAEAEAEAERRIEQLLVEHYQLKRLYDAPSGGTNPAPVEPPTLPTLTALPRPKTPHEAIDLAVERLTELHRLFPTANLVMELATEGAEERWDAFPEVGPGDWQWMRVGRWRELPVVELPPKSSFDYFVARFGSLTWLLQDGWPLPPEVDTHRSNGHSGPTTPLEILPGETFPLFEDLAKHRQNPDYLKLKLFMGSEECEGFAFDTRFTSDTGEHLIVWFDGHTAPALTGDVDDPIVPFGTWLLDKVETLSNQLLPWLALVEGP